MQPVEVRTLIAQAIEANRGLAGDHGVNMRQKGGSGLGLSIVTQIMLRLSGNVGFIGAPGGGTIFHVELPAYAGEGGELA